MNSETKAALDFYQLAECVGNPNAAQDGRSTSFLHGQALAAALTESQAEVERLRKILSYIPARLVITAKEIAGYGAEIKAESEEPTDEQ